MIIMTYEKPRIITEEEVQEMHRKKQMDRFTEDFLKFAYIKCAHCGKELSYQPKIPRNCEFLHLDEDGKLCFVNPEQVEPYCLDCIMELGGKSNDDNG